MLVDVFLAAVVALTTVPALVLGARGLLRHRPTTTSDDVLAVVVVVALRLLSLLLLLAAGALTLLSTILAANQDVELHGFVYVFFALALALALLILLTFGRPASRRARRRATPARR